MKSYSEAEVFTPREVELYERARMLVEELPGSVVYEVRCHELARAVQRVLCLPPSSRSQTSAVVDGKYLGVNHTWLELRGIGNSPDGYNILDVYAVGKMPMVQLIYADHQSVTGAKHREQYAAHSLERLGITIDEAAVAHIVEAFHANLFGAL